MTWVEIAAQNASYIPHAMNNAAKRTNTHLFIGPRYTKHKFTIVLGKLFNQCRASPIKNHHGGCSKA